MDDTDRTLLQKLVKQYGRRTVSAELRRLGQDTKQAQPGAKPVDDCYRAVVFLIVHCLVRHGRKSASWACKLIARQNALRLGHSGPDGRFQARKARSAGTLRKIYTDYKARLPDSDYPDDLLLAWVSLTDWARTWTSDCLDFEIAVPTGQTRVRVAPNAGFARRLAEAVNHLRENN